MDERSDTFRILIRKFDPFESAIAQQWRLFQEAERTSMVLDADSLDLHPLHEAIFASESPDGWDVAFLSSDWFAQAHAEQTVADLSPWLGKNPPADYPGGWTDSLLDLHHFNGTVLGLPYHDGPECLIYRTDLFAEMIRGSSARTSTSTGTRTNLDLSIYSDGNGHENDPHLTTNYPQTTPHASRLTVAPTF